MLHVVYAKEEDDLSREQAAYLARAQWDVPCEQFTMLHDNLAHGISWLSLHSGDLIVPFQRIPSV